MRRWVTLLALLATGILALAGSASALVTPKIQARSGQVDVLFEPTPGVSTFNVYRHSRTNTQSEGRGFTFVGFATVKWNGSDWTMDLSAAMDQVNDSIEAVQPDLNSAKYVVFHDRSDVTDYEEYYYVVREEQETQILLDTFTSGLGGWAKSGLNPGTTVSTGDFADADGNPEFKIDAPVFDAYGASRNISYQSGGTEIVTYIRLGSGAQAGVVNSGGGGQRYGVRVAQGTTNNFQFLKYWGNYANLGPAASVAVNADQWYTLYFKIRDYALIAKLYTGKVDPAAATPLATITIYDSSYVLGNGSFAIDQVLGTILVDDFKVVRLSDYWEGVKLSNSWGYDYSAAISQLNVVSAFPPGQSRHGSYTEFTGACTGCHGLHSAKSQEKLLKGPTVADLCGTCHDGTGSKYDEVNGWVFTGGNRYAPAPAGPFGDQLKAGATAPASSVHNIYHSGGPAYARVFQAPGSGFDNQGLSSQVLGNRGSGADYLPIGWTNLLSCVSCHEPHNKPQNYRLLRNDINDKASGDGAHNGTLAVRAFSEVNTAGLTKGNELWPKAYSDAPGAISGNNVRYSQVKPVANTSKFCSQCHRAFYNATVVPSRGAADRMLLLVGVTDENTKADIRGLFAALAALPPTATKADVQAAKNAAALTAGYATRGDVIYNTCSWGCHQIDYQAADGDENLVAGNLTGPVKLGQATGNRNLATADGAALGNVMGAGHRHPTEVPARRVLVSEKLIDRQTDTGDAMNLETQHRVKDGPVHIGLPLETSAGSFFSYGGNTYGGYKVVCLTCHMAHGSRSDPADADWNTWYVGDKRVEVAYNNGAANGTDSADVAQNATSGYYTYVGPDGQQTPEEKIIGTSTALARFSPMASVCFRCHSSKPR